MATRPNILWVLTTQWRAQATGYAGDGNVRTPALDRLAAAGADFTQAVTPHPFGPFARAAILTGVPSPANGVRGYFDPLPPGTRTIAHDVADAGYATAFFGKWHLAPRDPHAPLVGEAHARAIVPPEYRGGFHLWEGFESGFLLNDPWLHGTRLPEPVPFPGYQADVVFRRATAWMAEQPGSAAPWFCVVSVEPPHPPYAAPARDVAAAEPASLVLRPNVPPEAAVKAREELAGYYAHVAATDAAIGELLQNVPPHTVVIVTSVHGDMHGSHGLFRKGWPQEESVRVPLLVRLPESLDRGWHGVTDALVSLLDLPTWTRHWAAGRTLGVPRPAFQRLSMPSVVRLSQQCDRIWRGIRTTSWKYVEAVPSDSPRDGDFQPWLFFDLERDPYEQTNLLAGGAPLRYPVQAALAEMRALAAEP